MVGVGLGVLVLAFGAILLYLNRKELEEELNQPERILSSHTATAEIDKREEVFEACFEVNYEDKVGQSEDIKVTEVQTPEIKERMEYMEAKMGNMEDYALQDKKEDAPLANKSDKRMRHTKVALLGEDEAWSYVTGGIFRRDPEASYGEIKDELAEVQKRFSAQIKVPVWFWADPSDPTNMKKVTKELTLHVNSHLAEVFKNIFEDIYEDPTKPVINLQDSGFGTWVLRGINWSDSNRPSAHALGCAIDINPSSGSYNIDGVRYGNNQYEHPMPYSIWRQLPETHTKYHVLYIGCPIVEIFKSYGFYWGGDWGYSDVDVMHLAYLGDYGCREVGSRNYLERR